MPHPHDTCNPAPINNVLIVPGWTLRPQDNWYEEVADDLRAIPGLDLNITIADMPNPDNPDPAEWREAIDDYTPEPEHTMAIAHSLGFITVWNSIAARAAADPAFRQGALMSIAGNISDVGLEEITHHFSHDIDKLIAQAALLKERLNYMVLIYGLHDPYVPAYEGMFTSMNIDAPLYILEGEAHFSGRLVRPDIGLLIPSSMDRNARVRKHIARQGKCTISTGWREARSGTGNPNMSGCLQSHASRKTNGQHLLQSMQRQLF